MKFNTALIDMDVLCYRCGFAVESYNKEEDEISVEPIQNAFYNVNSMVKKILEKTGSDRYLGYITSNDKSNFRFSIFPDYKSNRKGVRKPYYYNEIREFLKNKWNAIEISGEEADDAISIEQCKLNRLGFDEDIKNSIICSIDKDFNNVPGWHYNFVQEKIYYVNDTDALRNFYLQILTGDTADGIPRIYKGWKQKKVEKELSQADNEGRMLQIVQDEIWDSMADNNEIELTDALINDILIQRARLVWLRREPEELWNLKKLIK